MDKRLVWKLPEYLEAHDITRYQLMQELGDGRGRVAYRWADLPQRLDTEALEGVLAALEKLTGDRISISDLLEYAPKEEAAPKLSAAGVPYTGDPETDAILDEHPDILERVRRFEAGETKTYPLREVMKELGL